MEPQRVLFWWGECGLAGVYAQLVNGVFGGLEPGTSFLGSSYSPAAFSSVLCSPSCKAVHVTEGKKPFLGLHVGQLIISSLCSPRSSGFFINSTSVYCAGLLADLKWSSLGLLTIFQTSQDPRTFWGVGGWGWNRENEREWILIFNILDLQPLKNSAFPLAWE